MILMNARIHVIILMITRACVFMCQNPMALTLSLHLFLLLSLSASL